MLLFTTLPRSASTFGQLMLGRASRRNLQRPDLNESIYWDSGYCAVDGFPDDMSTMKVCKEYGGTQCQITDYFGPVHVCVVPATDATVPDVKKDFENCGGDPKVYGEGWFAYKYFDKY